MPSTELQLFLGRGVSVSQRLHLSRFTATSLHHAILLQRDAQRVHCPLWSLFHRCVTMPLNRLTIKCVPSIPCPAFSGPQPSPEATNMFGTVSTYAAATYAYYFPAPNTMSTSSFLISQNGLYTMTFDSVNGVIALFHSNELKATQYPDAPTPYWELGGYWQCTTPIQQPRTSGKRRVLLKKPQPIPTNCNALPSSPTTYTLSMQSDCKCELWIIKTLILFLAFLLTVFPA